MTENRVCQRMWPFAVGFALLLQTAAIADLTIRLEGVPDSLVYPLEEGKNQILTATITDGDIKSVWLAVEKEPAVRLPLTAVGQGQYQINLAASDVSALLFRAGMGGQFRIFAETTDGETVASIPVRYSFGGFEEAPPTFHVYVDGQKHSLDCSLEDELFGELATSPYFNPSRVPEKARYMLRRRMYWFEPEAVERIVAEFPGTATSPAACASAGESSWPFSPTEASHRLTLTVTPEIRKAWRETGHLVLQHNQVRDFQDQFALVVTPERLDPAALPATLTVRQRTSEDVPGAEGFLRVTIGDITGGQTRLKLVAGVDRALVGPISVRQGEAVSFAWKGEHYRITVVRLANFLLGGDYAVLRVSKIESAEQDRLASDRKAIERLLDVVEKADVTYIREGEEYTGPEAAAHLRDKLRAAGPKLMTLERFIDDVASRSWLTGDDYRITLADGTTVKARDWLREKAGLEPAEEQ